MDKHAVAIVLEEIGTLLEIQGENKFKARAFINAARAIGKYTGDLTALVRRGELEGIGGIGPATAAVIRELIETGTARYYLDLRERTPLGLLELLAVPRLGVAKIKTLHDKLGIASINELEQAAHDGRIAPLPGFGVRTQEKILESIGYVRSIAGRRRYADAIELGSRLRGFAASLPGVKASELAGELRRHCETIDAIEVVVGVLPENTRGAIETFLALPGVARGENFGDARAVARLSDGVELRLECVQPEAFPTAIIFATGSLAHVDALRERAEARGLTLRADGLYRGKQRIAVDDENGVYEELGLDFVEPELRETGAEVDVAARGELPELLTYEDLRGTFHCHTSYSDGKASIEQMADAAAERGWRYLGIADHSQFAGYAGGLSPDEILRQHDEIDEYNAKHGKKVWLFKGIEADILPDGQLDYHDRPDLLKRFDYIVGSVHSGFGLSEEAQTERFLRVIENPYLTFLGHLTGRLLLSRRGYQIDIDRVLAAVAERGIGIEINSDPHRMEMDWRHWPKATALGIRTAINPDAHAQRQLDFVQYGVAIARKGWLEKSDVVNAGSLAEVKRFFKETRRA